MSRRAKQPPIDPGETEAELTSAERTTVDRRSFLAGSASLMALGTTSLLLGTANASEPEQSTHPMRVPGSGASPYGER